MPAYLYAWVLVSAIAFGAFTIARTAFAPIIEPQRIDAFRNIFLALTAIAFLTTNFWIAMALAAAVVLAFGRKEDVRPAIWVAAIFAAPAARKFIPGFAGINILFALTPVLVMTWAVLTPAMFSKENKTPHRYGVTLPDWCVIGYLALLLPLSFRGLSITAGLKEWLLIFFSIAPIYFVFSRYDWTRDRLNAVAVAFVAQFIALGLVALVEAATQWHHYYYVLGRWDFSFRHYTNVRSGFFRTFGPTMGPIAFGVFFMVAIAFATSLYRQMKMKWVGQGGFAVLGLGILSTVSRGPWVGAMATLGLRAAMGPGGASRIVLLGAAGVVGLGLAALTPMGARIISVLPIIGGGETETFDYRADLLRIGWSVAMENPLFGSVDYLDHPRMQTLVQGQGIVDIVNSYLQIVLDYGLVGLGLYLGAIGGAGWAALRSIKLAVANDPMLADYARMIASCFIGASLVLFTTTQRVAQLEEVYWMLVGLCVGVARRARHLHATGAAPAERAETEMAAAEAAPAPIAAREPDGTAPKKPPARPAIDPKSQPAHLRQYLRDRD